MLSFIYKDILFVDLQTFSLKYIFFPIGPQSHEVYVE